MEDIIFIMTAQSFIASITSYDILALLATINTYLLIFYSIV